MDQVSELLQTAVVQLRNIALFDNGKAFEAELRISDHEALRGDAFRKTVQEGKPTRPLLRPNSFQPLGTVQLSAIKGGIRVFGRMWASPGIKALTRPGVGFELQYKAIKSAGGECTEARLFTISLAKEKNVLN